MDKGEMLDCCKECEFDCKQHQRNFDSVFEMSGCLVADIEMSAIMRKMKESEKKINDRT